MSRTPREIENGIISTLRVTDPALSLGVGTPERKIVSAVSEAIAESYIDNYVATQQWDIDTLTGLELEEFCLVPGTKVVTPTGVVNIEDLAPGDKVITHTGEVHDILATSCRKVEEDVVTIKLHSGVKHTMTKNHPVLVTKKDDLTLIASQVGNWRRDGSKNKDNAFMLRGLGNKTVWDRKSITMDWVPAGDITPGDIVWGPAPENPRNGHNVPEEEKALLGYFIAEGHSAHSKSYNVGFTFNKDEVEYHQEVISLLNDVYGVSHTRTTDRGEKYNLGHAVQVNCWNKEAYLDILKKCGSGAENKHIPWDSFNSNESLDEYVRTYLNGDGDKNSRQSKVAATTVSADLAHQLFTYLLELGLSPHLSRHTEAGTVCHFDGYESIAKDSWRVYAQGESAKKLCEVTGFPLFKENTKNYSQTSLFHEGFVGSAVKSVETKQYEGNVHNIEVDVDNSYVLFGNFAVHNCALFGFGRILGRKATGTITFLSANPVAENVIIPSGTQAYVEPTITSPAIYFTTTTAGMIPKGEVQVEIPAQCTVTGLIGNVGVGTITGYVSQFGITGIANNGPFSGGVDAESDANLRARFRQTVLRNVAGTADFYRNLCLQHNSVSRVNVVGPVSRWVEQLQLSGGSATSTVTAQMSKYRWTDSEIVSTNIGKPGERFYIPETEYTVQAGTSPQIPKLVSKTIPDGTIVDVEHEYTSSASRNDPATGIMNKVDIYCNGSEPTTITEQVSTGSSKLGAAEGLYAAKNWQYVDNATKSVPSTLTVSIIGHGPVVAFPDFIVVGKTTYKEGVDYRLLRYMDSNTNSDRGKYAIGWSNAPAAGQVFTLRYEFNRVPAVLNALLSEKRQITTDPLVKLADLVALKINLIIMYSSGYETTFVDSSIKAALAQWMGTLDFGSWIQVSDIEQVVHNVNGVDNVRLTSRDDNIASVQRMERKGTTDTATWGTYSDFRLKDNELPIFHSVNIVRKSYNTFNPAGTSIHW